ncbi:unnamed protein product [Lymnaea stagnalis]|uniref:G-protein coupled receptors family 1 profile domain-containing protein n=1 Tax=Lymnaea stagnalis TaxID=6523 RepID=A0AAV2ILF5_LYMST
MNSSFVQILVTQNEFVTLMGLFTCVDMVLSLMGIVTNAVNTKTFLAMGADDGVTVSFLYLSASELMCCLAALGQKISMAFWVTELATDYETWFFINPYVVNAFFGNIRACLFEIPILTTTYLSLAKCMCVVKPLSFKSMFSVSRTQRIMAGVCVFSVLTYVPIFATMGTTVEFDLKVNRTRHMIWFAPGRDLVKAVISTTRDTISAIGSEVIVSICLMIVTKALHRSVRLRAQLKNGTFSGKINQRKSSLDCDDKISHKLSGKELQIIKQVALISVIFIAGNTPKIIVFLGVAFVPDLSPLGRYRNLYDVIIKSRELSELMTSVVNIFIYYKFNSKFRQCCRALF